VQDNKAHLGPHPSLAQLPYVAFSVPLSDLLYFRNVAFMVPLVYLSCLQLKLSRTCVSAMGSQTRSHAGPLIGGRTLRDDIELCAMLRTL